MAEQIATSHGLTTLRVGVRPHGAGMAAAVELVSYEGGAPAVLRLWWLSSVELGLPTRLTAHWRPTRHLPPAFVAELGGWLDRIGLAEGLPLWLHLVKPYGFLGAIDWEGALVGFLQRPLLRLPDFLERSRENRAVLDVALVCSEPVSEPRLDPPQLLADITAAVLKGSRRERTTIHLFADEQYFLRLKGRFAGTPQVVVHDPAGAGVHGVQERSSVGGSEPGRLRSPWLLWMRDSMQGRSLDAVHFVAHGYVADQRPAIALAESPLSNRDRGDARYVGVGELAAFLTQTGAWSAVFSCPPDNFSVAGLRLLADTLAQTRPGPVLHHRLEAGYDPQLQALYGFLYAGQPSPVPAQRDWFAYCQPALVERLDAAPQQPSAVSALDANARLFEGRQPAAPRNAAASEPTWPLDSPRITGAATPIARRGSRGGGGGGLDGQPLGRSGFDEGSDLTPSTVPYPAPAELPSWVSAAQRYVEQTAQQLQRRSGRDTASADEVERTLSKLQAVVASLADVPGSSGNGGSVGGPVSGHAQGDRP